MQALFLEKYEVSQPFENPLENPIGGQTVLLAKGEVRDDSRKHSVCLLRLLGSGRANGAGRKSNCANFLPSLSASTTTIPYKREESRDDQANGSFWARRNRELCSTRHALRINIEANFYAVTARLERQRKKRKRIAVSSDLRRAILGDIYTGDLFGGL